MSSSSQHLTKPTTNPRRNIRVQQAHPKDRACELCEEATAANKCVECEQWICDRCKRLHNRQKATAHHKFTTLSDLQVRIDDDHDSPPPAGNDNRAANATATGAASAVGDDTVEEITQDQLVRHVRFYVVLYRSSATGNCCCCLDTLFC